MRRARTRCGRVWCRPGPSSARSIPPAWLIVAGLDTGLVGYGLHREIELYVAAGMTPMEAIQSATLVPARAMGLDHDSGTVEVGKRADLILVDGDPLQDILILRRVTRVIADGRVYDAAALWRSVGFRP